MPVIASYGDALGIRLFAERRNLEDDLTDHKFNEMRSLCPVPLINRLLCHKLSSAKRFSLESTQWKTENNENSGMDPEALEILDTVNASVLGATDMLLNVPFAAQKNWRFLALEAARTLPMQGRDK